MDERETLRTPLTNKGNMTAIEKSQEQKYQRCKAILTGWREQTTLACQAYHEAKKSECWRLHHDHWIDFIDACGLTKEWARQLSKTGERIEELTALLTTETGGNSVAPENAETLAKVNSLTPGIRKVLDSVPLASQVKVLAETKAEKPTVKEVKKLVEEKKAAQIHEAEVIHCDFTDIQREIPADVLPLWQEGCAVYDEIMPHLRAVKSAMKHGIDGREEKRIWIECANTDVSPVQQLINTIELSVKPHAVCPTCNGHATKKSCKLCKGRGYIGKHLWTSCVPEETKKMLAKAATKRK